MSEETEYVKGSQRQTGYMRRKPYTYRLPSKAQRQARGLLARLAVEKGRDRTGLVEIEKDGVVKDIPASAVPVMEEMKGVQLAPLKPAPLVTVSPYDALKRTLEVLATYAAR